MAGKLAICHTNAYKQVKEYLDAICAKVTTLSAPDITYKKLPKEQEQWNLKNIILLH